MKQSKLPLFNSDNNSITTSSPLQYSGLISHVMPYGMAVHSNLKGKGQRAVAFLDPFALQVKWSTIEAIAKTQAIDMWLLFPAMAVNRMLPNSGLIPEAWAERLNALFGEDDWKSFFYRKPMDTDLFGELFPASKVPQIFQNLSDYVTHRLSSVFNSVHEKPLLLKNRTGSPLFLLCFASGNPTGAPVAIKIAQHIINQSSHGQ